MSVEKLQLATVKIETRNSTGTGFFIGSNHIMTCGHVIASSRDHISFIWRGERQCWSCSIKELHDPDANQQLSWLDIAILEIDFLNSLSAPPPSVRLEIDDPTPGEMIYTFGYPANRKRSSAGGESNLLTYEGNYYLEEYWGASLYKLKDSIILGGMSGSPLYHEERDCVHGIVQWTRNYDYGAKGLAVSTLAKYVPSVISINNVAISQQKIWLEFPKIQASDIELKQGIFARLLMIKFLGINGLFNFLTFRTLIKTNHEKYQLPHQIALRLISCSHSTHKISKEINSVLEELDHRFRIDFGKRRAFEDLSIELQKYILIGNFVSRFSLKSESNYIRILDVLDTSDKRYEFLDKNIIDLQQDEEYSDPRKLNLWNRRQIFVKSMRLFRSNSLRSIKKQTSIQYSKINEILQQLSKLRENNSLLYQEQWTELVKSNINNLISENLNTLSWSDISLIRNIEILLCQRSFLMPEEEYPLYSEIGEYYGFVDLKRNTYHWNDSCHHLSKLKWTFFGQCIQVRRGAARPNELSIRGVFEDEHHSILSNYEKHGLNKCLMCHPKLRRKKSSN